MTITSFSLLKTPLTRILVITACTVIVLAGMRAAASILNALLLAIVIALIFLPLQSWLRQRGLNPTLAFVVTALISLLVGVSAVLVIAFSILHVSSKLPSYQGRLQEYLDPVISQLQRFGLSPETFGDTVLTDSQSVIQFAVEILKSVGDTLGTVLLMYLFLFYLLMEGEEFEQRLHHRWGIGDPYRAKLFDFINTTRLYVASRTRIGVGIAVIQTAIMLTFGVNYAVLWGLLSFVCNFIPNVGFLIGLLPPAALLLLEQEPGSTILFVILYSATNMVIENVLAPKLVGTQVHLSPLTVFVSLIFWTWVLGPLGALLGLPLTLFIKVVLLGADSNTPLSVGISASGQPIETQSGLSNEAMLS